MKDDINFLLLYLLDKTNYNGQAWIYHETQNGHLNLNGAFSELARLNAIHIRHAQKEEQYLLKEPVREMLLNRPANYKDDPYGYLIAREKASDEQKAKKEKIDLLNAERVYKTYPLTRVLAWVGAISGVATLLIKLAEIFGWLSK